MYDINNHLDTINSNMDAINGNFDAINNCRDKIIHDRETINALMLSYNDALARVLAAASPLAAEPVAITDAPGRALAADVVANENLPPFDNSAVDGYALRGDFTVLPVTLRVSHTVFAGDDAGIMPDDDGVCVRVMTGAPVPVGAERVVMQEDTEPLGDGIAAVRVMDAGSPRFIRRAGSDVKTGETVLNAGDIVDAGAVGLFASLGIGSVSCPAKPRVGILSTGDELVAYTTRTLAPAKIRDSNRHALAVAVEAAGGIVDGSLHAPDNPDAIREALLSLSGCDIVISSGGVSVGSADYVKAIVEEIGTLTFWRVAIKPGKPLAFGSIGNAVFFGLPGNPASSLVTFELFVRPVIRRFAGHTETSRPQITATLTHDLPHETGRREFIRARLEYKNGVAYATPTGAQTSHRTASYVGANALLVAHEDHGDYAAGETLPALLLV